MRDTVTCVFVHGWAMNSAVWHECVNKLPDWINTVVVDLPGHGTMAGVQADSLDDYVHALAPSVQQPAIWVGWSLGGLVALRLAELYPQRVTAALLVACNPCFVSRPEWPCAVDAETFDRFADDLNKNQEKTIRRFLALQVRGLPDAMTVVRQLQASMQSRGQATTQALHAGLQVLLKTNLQQTLKLIECPLHWSLGGKDSLVPAALAQVLTEDYAQQNVVLNPAASHAPFISHLDSFIEQLLVVAEKQRRR